jgi:histone acetyltransferase (RNA polymerase elongator complex component)
LIATIPVFLRNIPMKKQITIPVFIPHRGCPHDCIFCNQRTVSGSEHSEEAEQIISKVREYRTHASPAARIELGFFGGSFTGIDTAEQNAFLSKAHWCLKEELIHAIRLSTRPDYINDEICTRLLSYGVSIVELGIQSFNDDVLVRAKRGHTAADSVRALETLHRHKLNPVIQLLPGLPGDSYDASIASAITAASLSPSAVRIYPAVVLKHTELAAMYKKGEYMPLSLDEAVQLCADMVKIFSDKGIPVIKTGLHPLKDALSDQLIAGPYHPAFGFLVRARIRRNELAEIAGPFLALHDSVHSAHLQLPVQDAEEFIGEKRKNIEWLKEHFKLSSLTYSISKEYACPTFSTD